MPSSTNESRRARMSDHGILQGQIGVPKCSKSVNGSTRQTMVISLRVFSGKQVHLYKHQTTLTEVVVHIKLSELLTSTKKQLAKVI